MIQKLKKNKKGFTLVELLVVLVIIAILAAAIIPSMMGFIDKAKQQSAAAECRSVLLAGEVQLNELYGTGATINTTAYDSTTDVVKAIQTLADVPGTINSITFVATGTAGHYTIGGASYTTNGQVYTYTLTDGTGAWTSAKATA